MILLGNYYGYDEIGKAMFGNPFNPHDSDLVKKLASIGIGPGKTPSTQVMIQSNKHFKPA